MTFFVFVSTTGNLVSQAVHCYLSAALVVLYLYLSLHRLHPNTVQFLISVIICYQSGVDVQRGRQPFFFGAIKISVTVLFILLQLLACSRENSSDYSSDGNYLSKLAVQDREISTYI